MIAKRYWSSQAFTLIEIMIVVAIIGVLVTTALPSFMHARVSAQSRACGNNLKQMDAAKQMWGMENGKSSADVPTESDLIGATLYLRKWPSCPAGGTYQFNAVGVPSTCTEIGHTLTP